MILCQSVATISRKLFFFDDIVHFIDEGNIVAYLDFDCGSTF